MGLPLVRHQDVVDAPQFGVDLQAEVGQGLGGRLHHVLHLDTLGGHAQQGVSHPLHLRCGGRGTHKRCLRSRISKKYVFKCKVFSAVYWRRENMYINGLNVSMTPKGADIMNGEEAP